MKEKVCEILKGWGFETDEFFNLAAHKKMCNGMFVYNPYINSDNDELVFEFYSRTETTPSHRCATQQIIPCEKLRQMPPQGIEPYLKIVCRSMVDCVVAKILFTKIL